MNIWSREFEVYRRLNTANNDRIEVKEGMLVLTKGTHDRAKGISITSNPKVLADYLERLIDQTARSVFDGLQKNPSYEEVTLFRKQIKILTKKILDLQISFRSHDIGRKVQVQRYKQLFQKANALYIQAEELKKAINRPLLSDRPIVHYAYDVEDCIKYLHPKRVPVQETVAAAQKALKFSLKEPLVKKIARIVLFSLPLMGASIIHACKLILWNPFERLICGQLQTESPFDKLVRLAFPGNPHFDQMLKLAHQLLRTPAITSDAVNGICAFAPYFTKLELKNVKIIENDIMAYAPLMKRKNIQEYLEALKKVCDEKKIHRVSLNKAQDLLDEFYKYPRKMKLEDFLAKHSEKPQVVDGKFYFFGDAPDVNEPHLSKEGLLKIVTSMVQSSKCSSIELSETAYDLPGVSKILETRCKSIHFRGPHVFAQKR